MNPQLLPPPELAGATEAPRAILATLMLVALVMVALLHMSPPTPTASTPSLALSPH